MAADILEAKAHDLIGKLKPGKLAAIVHLLEVMVHDEEHEVEELTEEDRRALRASDEYFRNGGQGVPFEQVVTECGFTMDQIRAASPKIREEDSLRA